MMLSQIIEELKLTVLTNPIDFNDVTPTGGYTADLLSCVMASAKKNNIWVTLQSHTNVIAVAALLELAAVIITEGAIPDQDTIDKANVEGVTLLSTNKASYEIAGRLWENGIRTL
jgi:hypothetical protein